MSYTYDLASRLTGITYPYNGVGTRSVARGYDDANRLTSVTDWLSKTANFTYDADSNITQVKYPGSVLTSTVSYDAADEVTSIKHQNASAFFFSQSSNWSNVGTLTSTGDNLGVATHSYEYDPLYRLAGDKVSGSNTISGTWSYNAATQTTSSYYKLNASKAITSTRTYDGADELKTLLDMQNNAQVRNLTLSYNKNGDRTQQVDAVSSITTNFGYDGVDRLTSFSNGTTSATYAYNGDGERMSKVVGASTTHYTWDGGAQAGLDLLLQDSNGGSYIYGPGCMLLEEVPLSDTTHPYYYSSSVVVFFPYLGGQ